MSSPEILQSCPKCGTSGFTPRGLKAHVCKGINRDSKALVPATPVAVEVVDESAEPDDKSAKLRILAEQFVQAHGAITLYLARGVAGSALCGKIATEIKKSLKHGEWIPFIKRNFEPHGIAERTVQYHMQVWEAAKAKALKSSLGTDAMAMLEAPIDSLSESQRDSLLKIASQVCQGANADQLLIEAGLKKETKEKGGKREKEKELTPEEIEAAKDKQAQDTYQSLYVTITQAQNEHRELLLRLPLTVANPEEQISLVHLRDQLKPLVTLLDDVIATRTSLKA